MSSTRYTVQIKTSSGMVVPCGTFSRREYALAAARDMKGNQRVQVITNHGSVIYDQSADPPKVPFWESSLMGKPNCDRCGHRRDEHDGSGVSCLVCACSEYIPGPESVRLVVKVPAGMWEALTGRLGSGARATLRRWLMDEARREVGLLPPDGEIYAPERGKPTICELYRPCAECGRCQCQGAVDVAPRMTDEGKLVDRC